MKTLSVGRSSLWIIFAVALPLLFTATGELNADLAVFNSDTQAGNTTTRTAWLTAIGVSSPQYLVDFETGFTHNQNITSGWTDVGGLTISSTYSGTGAKVVSGSGSIGGSNPVGTYGLWSQNTGLVFAFSTPVDYVAFQDIDQQNTVIKLYFTDGSTSVRPGLDTTASGDDSAEFVGFFRNDLIRITKMEFTAEGLPPWGVDNIEYGRSPAVGPIPGAVWHLGSGLLGLVAIKRKFRK